MRGVVARVLLFVSLFTWATPQLQAAVDQRELRAREAFAVGRYQEALDLFGKLYAEKLHPNYLRNIGRCYQNLGDPEPAITSFKDYLRKAKGITTEERAEVDGFIQEMENLKVKRDNARAPAPAVASSESPKEQAQPSIAAHALAASPPPAESSASVRPVPGVELRQAGAAPPSDDQEGPPVYKRWWFWGLIGAAAAAGIGVAAAAGVFTKTETPPCNMPGFRC
ncbi:MAG: hypothetical protein H7X95_01785 [Deltaproteobacteria bacterium]|nr:hypothetical protein [Deltaproteobacteria bacterium]